LVEEAASQSGVEVEFLVLSARDDGETTVASNAEVFPIDRKTLFTSTAFRNAIKGVDFVLDIGGGDSFADIYNPKRFAYIWATKAVVISTGTPLILSPQTIGPFTKQPYKALASWVLNRTALTIARDPTSFDVIGKLAPTARRLLAADVAFRLPYHPVERAPSSRRRVGLNVSGLLWEEAVSGRNKFGLSYDYAVLTRALIEKMLGQSGIEVQLITHANSKNEPADDDAHVADLLALDYPELIRVPDFKGPSEVKSYISGLDILIAARMHACIAAFSAGVAVIPISYSRKFSGLFEGTLDYRHFVPERGLSNREALALIEAKLLDVAELKHGVALGNRRVEPLLADYIRALSEFFHRAAN
jgi:polysaccharide pyruvyl transferase WcaK-like protein